MVKIAFNPSPSAHGRPWQASSSLLRLPTLQRDVVSFGSVLHACDHGGRWITALGCLATGERSV